VSAREPNAIIYKDWWKKKHKIGGGNRGHRKRKIGKRDGKCQRVKTFINHGKVTASMKEEAISFFPHLYIFTSRFLLFFFLDIYGRQKFRHVGRKLILIIKER